MGLFLDDISETVVRQFFSSRFLPGAVSSVAADVSFSVAFVVVVGPRSPLLPAHFFLVFVVIADYSPVVVAAAAKTQLGAVPGSAHMSESLHCHPHSHLTIPSTALSHSPTNMLPHPQCVKITSESKNPQTDALSEPNGESSSTGGLLGHFETSRCLCSPRE